MLFISFLTIENLNPLLYEDLSSIALRFGPFFFSLFFAVFFIPWAQKKYRKTTQQTNPAPTDRQRKIYAWYFVASGIFCVSLIIVCVTWWISIQGSSKIITGEIQNVGDHVEISSPDLYLRAVKYDNISSKNYYFVYSYSSNTNLPDRFQLHISKMGRPAEIPIYVKCKDVSENQIFKYEYIGDKDEHRVVSVAENRFSKPRGLIKAAYANYNISSNYDKRIIEHLDNKRHFVSWPFQEYPVNMFHINRLQNETTPVGEKIMIIDTLLAIQDNDEVYNYLKTISTKEPFIITLMDLSRHSDSELAYKTSKLLKPYPIEEILYEIISLESDQITQFETLSRLPIQTSQHIFEIDDEHDQSDLLNNYRQEIEAGNIKQGPLYPTGSRKGDRYYVKATWDKNDQNTFNCLCELFNKELITDRTLEEEKKLMIEKGTERYVYWYTKEWSLHIAKEIEACGGNAEYIGL